MGLKVELWLKPLNKYIVKKKLFSLQRDQGTIKINTKLIDVRQI